MKHTMDLTDIPVMSVRYGRKGSFNTIEIQANNAFWKYQSADGNILNIIIGDIQHPMDIVNQLSKIEIPENLHTLSFDFSSAPDALTVKYWPDQYAGFREAYDVMHENMKVKGKSIVLPNEDQGYVIQVHAMWPQGNANYEFYLVHSLT